LREREREREREMMVLVCGVEPQYGSAECDVALVVTVIGRVRTVVLTSPTTVTYTSHNTTRDT